MNKSNLLLAQELTPIRKSFLFFINDNENLLILNSQLLSLPPHSALLFESFFQVLQSNNFFEKRSKMRIVKVVLLLSSLLSHTEVNV